MSKYFAEREELKRIYIQTEIVTNRKTNVQQKILKLTRDFENKPFATKTLGTVQSDGTVERMVRSKSCQVDEYIALTLKVFSLRYVSKDDVFKLCREIKPIERRQLACFLDVFFEVDIYDKERLSSDGLYTKLENRGLSLEEICAVFPMYREVYRKLLGKKFLKRCAEDEEYDELDWLFY